MPKSAALGQIETPKSMRLGAPLKWAGGKRWLLPVLEQLYSPYRKARLVEPFLGGMSVTLGLLPKRALLSDVNPHSINFFLCLKRGLHISAPMRNDRRFYNRMRLKFNRMIGHGRAKGDEAAALFYYLNRTGFNGLCRFNSSGQFNVPFGKYSNIGYRNDFEAYQEVLENYQFKCSDFEKLKLKPSDFIYADPPYDVEFTRYAQQDFSWEDQQRLAEWLAAHPGPVVASNQATPRILQLYRKLGFNIRTVSAPRMISCSGDRTRATEMLATRNLPILLLKRAIDR